MFHLGLARFLSVPLVSALLGHVCLGCPLARALNMSALAGMDSQFPNTGWKNSHRNSVNVRQGLTNGQRIHGRYKVVILNPPLQAHELRPTETCSRT
jgi:hypothetical protein